MIEDRREDRRPDRRPSGAPRGELEGTRLLFVIDSLGTGGTERSLAELVPAVMALGARARVAWSGPAAPEHLDLLRAAGTELRPLGPVRGLARVLALRREVRRLRPHLVHSALFASNLACRLAVPGSGAVLLQSLVNLTYGEVRYRDPAVRPHRLRLVQALDGWTGRHRVDHFHAVSEAVRQEALEVLRIPADRVTTVPRGRDPLRLGAPSPARREEARRRLGVPGDAELVLHVGRCEPAKGQEDLLRAFSGLAKRRPRARLLVAGARGSRSAALERLQGELGLGEQVRFLGHRDDVPELLAAADLFVFPSLREGLPGALLEAMALALPVVASDIAPIREVAEPGRTALLVPPSSPAALESALEAMLERPDLRAALGEAGRQRFLDRFTLEHSLREMVALYRRLLDRGRR